MIFVNRKSFLVRVTVTLITLAVTASVPVIWSINKFGTSRGLLAIARRQSLFIQPTLIAFGDLDVNATKEISVDVFNMTRNSIQLQGVVSSCSCISARVLPITIPIGGKRSFIISIKPRANQAGKDVDQKLYISTNAISGQETIIIKGHIK